MRAAKRASTAVVFVDDANTTTTTGDVGTLGPNEDALVARVAAANPHTVVVLNTNGAVLMPWLHKVKSALEMWYPGQEGGTATADLLYGITSPSGGLPLTFPRSDGATPFAGHPERSTGVDGQITWSDGLELGYRWYLAHRVKPLFPFGYGLSYTGFHYDGLQVAPATTRAGRTGPVRVSFTVHNTGAVRGATAPQVYLRLPAAAHEPPARLVGFTRVRLDPGASRRVTLTLEPASTARPLSIWDDSSHSWEIVPGRYTVSVGQSAASTPDRASFTLH